MELNVNKKDVWVYTVMLHFNQNQQQVIRCHHEITQNKRWTIELLLRENHWKISRISFKFSFYMCAFIMSLSSSISNTSWSTVGPANGKVWAWQTYYNDSRRDGHMVSPDNATSELRDCRWHHLAHRPVQNVTHKVTNTSSSPQTKTEGAAGVVLQSLLIKLYVYCYYCVFFPNEIIKQ